MVQGILEVEQWEETFIYQQSISKVSATYRIEGQISGVLHAEYTIYYKAYNPLEKQQSESIYNGYLVFNGMIGQAVGGFVMEEYGHYDDKGSQSKVVILDGTGTGAFQVVHGDGKYGLEGNQLVFQLDIQTM